MTIRKDQRGPAMREDMARVIVERPRIKPWSERNGRRWDLADLPGHEGMRRGHAWRGDRKQLNENLAPLRRYLARQVGRPWNKIYSEISAHLRVESAVQQHVRDHLKDFVAIKPRRHVQGWRSSLRANGLWWQEFYVDPVTSLLCRTDRLPEQKRRRRAARVEVSLPVERISVDADRELRLIKGLWHELRLSPLPTPEYRAVRQVVQRPLTPWMRDSRLFDAEMDVRELVSPPVRDVVTGQLIEVGPAIDNPESWKAYRRKCPDRRYAVGKRMLSSRELKQHGLSNTASD